MLENKVHSLLDKYDYKSELADIFGRSGIIWLKTLDVSTIDRLIMNTTLSAIENINLQIDSVSKELAKYGWDSDFTLSYHIDLRGNYRNKAQATVTVTTHLLNSNAAGLQASDFTTHITDSWIGLATKH